MTYEHVYDQGSGKINEDAWFANESTFAVFDGATGLNKYTNDDGKTGGYLAANIAAEIFENTGGTLLERFDRANIKILDAMRRASALTTDKANHWCTGLAALEISDNTMNWVQISDCLIVLIHRDGSHRQLIKNYDHDTETLMLGYELAKKKTENIRELLTDQILKVRRDSNVTYGVMNGEKEVSNFLNSGSESLTDVEHILLFTDGLFIPKEDPAKPDDFDTLVSIYLKHGIAAVKDYVRELEKADPELWKYPRFKQHDDIAAIAVSL